MSRPPRPPATRAETPGKGRSASQANTQIDTRSAAEPSGAKALPDRQLIALLQADARASTAQLARKLGVARTTVVARLARLEASGVIVGYTVRLGVDSADRGIQAYVGITVQPKAGRDVVKRLSLLPELRQLASVSGEFDYMALLRAESTMRLDTLLDEIGEIEGVIKTTSSVVLALRVDRSA
ncbi:Lrp/AsnC family transcriptional regulator [Roseateles koreensis]|uniref:Lrp/AsnC family transcriptional regulator n=1 Tax=Roseateles koreensis TaxID=2987526 RepID=A0ABT5KVP9_9BURK|nr:Lrp/AsnC family transcriptional regulator [Roseateles koreensis]MDC8786500.1 Lrp/AsnC family transcriptional regulator [Roseateles koreensis]